MAVRVILETTPKRSFASALDWPGWARGAKTEDEALEALVEYGARYAAVASRAGIGLKPPATVRGLSVAERVEGGSSTDFGIPAAPSAEEDAPIKAADLRRLRALLEASWETFDAVAADARGTSLRLGPRGGGRQVPKIVSHVRDAQRAYLNQLGSRPPADPTGVRETFLATLEALANDEPIATPNRVRKPWSPRYAVRRSAWHALDHAWEIEDRSG